MTAADLIAFEQEIAATCLICGKSVIVNRLHYNCGRKHYNYRDGRSLEQHGCIVCGKTIGYRVWYYASQKCASCVKKGKQHSEDHKRKIALKTRPYQFAKGHTTNAGKAAWNKGKRYAWSEERRLRHKDSPNYFRTGALHPNWKGGICRPSLVIRTSEQFARWRKTVYHKDNYRCVVCGSNKQIEAHHIVPLSELIAQFQVTSLEQAYQCSMLWDVNNGETRCRPCHKLTMGGQQKH